MPHPYFDRNRLKISSLKDRISQINILERVIPLDYRPVNLDDNEKEIIKSTAIRILKAKKDGKSVILAFGAHTVKNGLGLFLIELMKKHWVTHLATNGAGIIHDWEFAFIGKSGENVKENVKQGMFGIWEETGFFINLAIISGAYEKLGYGESVGRMVSREGIDIPGKDTLLNEAARIIKDDPIKASAAIDFYDIIEKKNLKEGFLKISHPFKDYSIQCAAYDLDIPFTGHPMIGHDIIYNHPSNCGAAIGRTALNDFLSFTDSISRIDGGVYLSVGSAVMSPMVFEKALSMAQNCAIQEKMHIDNHIMVVVDLAKNEWDWDKYGEPPADNPAYYLRYCKTFSRMGGKMTYISADNRDFLSELYHNLKSFDPD